MALLVKNLPANTGDKGGAGQEDPLEEDMETHSSILAWRIQYFFLDRGAWQDMAHGITKNWT